MQASFPIFSSFRFSELTTDNIIPRKAKEAESNWETVNYQFLLQSSNTTLRHHIEKNHLQLYQTLAEEKGWKQQLPGLVSKTRTQPSNEAANSQGERPDKFDQSTFNQYLLNFIVADDQV